MLAYVNFEALLHEVCVSWAKAPIAEDYNRWLTRVIRSWNELFNGYGKRAEDVLITQNFMPIR
jgi:hypothetical protein